MAVLAEQVDDGVVDILSADEDSPSNCDSDASVASASQSSESTAATSESRSSRSDYVHSFLTKLRSPRRSDLTRKRKFRQNSAQVSRKRKPSCSTDPRSVTPLQRVREFPNEALTVSAGKLFCTACRDELSLKISIVKGHVKTVKHLRGIKAIADRRVRERDISQSLKQYDQEVRPVGETLPESQRVFRVKVVSAFLRAGVPLSKLHHFREVLEQHAYRLADRRGMYDLIPFVLANETKRLKAEIEGRNVSIIFDGTTRLGEALAIIVRFVIEWKIEQRLVRLQLLTKSMSGEEIAREISNTLCEVWDFG